MTSKKISIMEYVDKNFTTVKFVAYGHHDITEFEKNCFDQFSTTPRKSFCGYHRKKSLISGDGRKYSTMAQCASTASNSYPITIGII